jgi:hypothetical protein
MLQQPHLSATLLVAALLLAACGNAGAAGSPTPEPLASLSPHNGDRYGYTVDLPADWELDEQSGDFDPFARNNPWSVGLDTHAAAGEGRFNFDMAVAVGAAPVEDGMTLERFTDHVIRGAPCRPHVAEDDGTLGGEPSRETEFVCPNGVSWLQVTAVHHGEGYVMLVAARERPFISSRPLARAIIESFAFDG